MTGTGPEVLVHRTFVVAPITNMKFVQVGKLVGLFCLCLGATLTGAQGCGTNSAPCSRMTDCCDGLNCVNMWRGDTLKRCFEPGLYGFINHCIPEGKQCNNGKRPHFCCRGLGCFEEEGDNPKSYCRPCVAYGRECDALASICCPGLACVDDSGTNKCFYPE